MQNMPLPLGPAEWDEVAAMPEVRDFWGLSADEVGKDFAPMVYGVKFEFISGGPGYAGDLFIIHGDGLGAPPVVLVRDSRRRLRLVEY